MVFEVYRSIEMFDNEISVIHDIVLYLFWIFLKKETGNFSLKQGIPYGIDI